MDLRHLERKLAPFAQPESVDDVAALGDELVGGIRIARLDNGQSLASQRLELLDVDQIRARQEQIGHRRKLAPLLEVGVEADRSNDRPLADVTLRVPFGDAPEAQECCFAIAGLFPSDAGVELGEGRDLAGVVSLHEAIENLGRFARPAILKERARPLERLRGRFVILRRDDRRGDVDDRVRRRDGRRPARAAAEPDRDDQPSALHDLA